MSHRGIYSTTNLAWARHWRERLCPPLSLLGKNIPAIDKHLEICSECSDRLSGVLFASERKPAQNVSSNKKMLTNIKRPIPGEIRRVLKDAEMGDSHDEYFNQPLVIVLEVPPDPYDFVKVAQLHRESELSSPNDIPLSLNGEEDDPFFSYFAESWNCYPLMNEYLGPVLGKASNNVVKEILRNENLPLPQVDEDTPVEAFRELEIEVAHHFALKSFQKSYIELIENVKEGADPRHNIDYDPKETRMPLVAAASLVAFPFLGPVLGAFAGGVAAMLSATGAVVGSASLLATGALAMMGPLAMAVGLITAGTITAQVLSENLKIKSQSENKAYMRPSKEQEHEFIEKKNGFLRKAEELKTAFGKNVPVEQQRMLLKDSSIILGSLEGNSRGLRDNGDTPSPEAQKAIIQLRSFHKEVGLAKAA